MPNTFRRMRVLFGCEESQACTIAFREAGHEAYSCDKLPCSGGKPKWHLQMDVVEALTQHGPWDMFVYFPECKYIAGSGLHWNTRVPGRSAKTDMGLQFACTLWNLAKRLGIKKIAFENPVGCISTRVIKDVNEHLIVMPNVTTKGFKPLQTIQPYEFGEDASKRTCLWAAGLPRLQGTEYFPPRITEDGKKRWGNQTDSGQNRLGPSDSRSKDRAKTYPGIARAMATQWGKVDNK